MLIAARLPHSGCCKRGRPTIKGRQTLCKYSSVNSTEGSNVLPVYT